MLSFESPYLHRDQRFSALWRDHYDEREKEQLKALIDGAKEKGVTFFYGISPGLDISYSNDQDIRELKAKLDDLKAIGCEAFAILWDDIDTTLPEEDRDAFESLAHAQVKVSDLKATKIGSTFP